MFEFRLPDLGEGIHEGEILKWHVAVGDSIKEDAPLVDVQRGIGRHVVRFVSLPGGIFALKELPPRIAERESQCKC